MFPLNPRTIAEMALQYAVALKATQIAERAVVQYSSIDPDSISVKVGTTVAGHLVAWKLRPQTDKIVGIVARRVNALKPNKIK